MRRFASAPVGLGCLLVLSACGAEGHERQKPMGAIPNVETKAVPEWLPFTVRAGAVALRDPRESHLAELRVLTTDEEVSRVTWSPDGGKLALEAKKKGEPHSQIYVMDLGTGETPGRPSPQWTLPARALRGPMGSGSSSPRRGKRSDGS